MWARVLLWAILAVFGVGGASANAEIAAAYLRGQGGFTGRETAELAPGGESPSLGTTLGVEAGARVLLFEGYLNHDRLLPRGAASRAILGLRAALPLGDLRLAFRGGAGLLVERDRALTGGTPLEGVKRNGATVRFGASLEHPVDPWLLLGVGLDAEYYALEPEPQGPIASIDGGYDVFGSLRMTFELGL